jgi:hypothetical protein
MNKMSMVIAVATASLGGCCFSAVSEPSQPRADGGPDAGADAGPPTRCAIGGVTYPDGATNPRNACQSCQLATSSSDWTDLADGLACGQAGECSQGACIEGCLSDGGYVALGGLDRLGCERCEAAGGWSALPDGTPCAPPLNEGAVCYQGTCDLGCFIGGVFFYPSTLNPQNSCQRCDGIMSVAQWSNLLPGDPCAGGGVCDSNGVCQATDGGTLGPPSTLLIAGAGQSFGALSMAGDSSEQMELMYAVAVDGGYLFNLQHLSQLGAPSGDVVQVAVGDPQLPPIVSVATDGVEVTCCWDDYGFTTMVFGNYCDLSQQNPLVKCNSVGASGTAPDGALGGGFTACGHEPRVAASSGDTLLAYLQGGVEEYQPLFKDLGAGVEGDRAAVALGLAAVPGGFEILRNNGQQFAYLFEGRPLFTSPYVYNPIPGITDPGSFAAASASGLVLGIVVQQGPAVSALTVGLPPGTIHGPVTISSAGEEALGPVAAVDCGLAVGLAYAVDGGNVMFREISLAGTPVDTHSTLIANLGMNAQSIGFAALDGGLYLGVGTPTQIGVYSVACP